MSEPNPVTYDRWVSTELWNNGFVRYPTTTNQYLEIGEGSVSLRFRFDLDFGPQPEPGNSPLYNLVCLQRVTDSSGHIWQARSSFRPDLFVFRMLDLDNLKQPRWQHNAGDWLQVIQERPLARGLNVLMDDRFYRRFWVDDAMLEIKFKYQALTIDIGHLDQDQVVVRLKGWFGTWNHVPMDSEGGVPLWTGSGQVRPPESDCDDQENPIRHYPLENDEEVDVPGGWLESLSPILFTMWNSEFLFRNDAAWERSWPARVPFPRPIVFEPVAAERGEPQEVVKIVPTA